MIDKRSGKEMFYGNKVVKFRDISLRGPWTSGGESNSIMELSAILHPALFLLITLCEIIKTEVLVV